MYSFNLYFWIIISWFSLTVFLTLTMFNVQGLFFNRRHGFQLCYPLRESSCESRYVRRCVITCYRSLFHLLSCPLPMQIQLSLLPPTLPKQLSRSLCALCLFVCVFSLFPQTIPALPLPASLPGPTCRFFSRRLLEGEAKFGWNSWLPRQHFVPPRRIGTGTGLSVSVCRQDLGHALCEQII